MDANCIFCKIINGDIPSDKVYEDDFAVAFMDIRPVSRGHTLVLPKTHASDVLSTPDEVLAKFLPLLKKISAAVVKLSSDKPPPSSFLKYKPIYPPHFQS